MDHLMRETMFGKINTNSHHERVGYG